MAGHLIEFRPDYANWQKEIYEYDHNIKNTFYQIGDILTAHPLIFNEFVKASSNETLSYSTIIVRLSLTFTANGKRQK